jgi:uncharacterized membrane protein HdeD (DUF308 family)
MVGTAFLNLFADGEGLDLSETQILARLKEAFMSTSQPTDIDRLHADFAKSLHDRWSLFLIEGIVLLILGVLAFLLPPLATLGITIVVGWLFLISGIMGLVTTYWARHAPGFWWSLVSALLGIGAGVILLARPVTGAVSLTLVLIAFFIIEGVASIMYALDHRKQSSGRWGWMLLSGVIDLVLAAMIFSGLPGTAAWALGLLVGINMIFGGSALIALALAARKEPPSTMAPRPT